MSMTLYNITDAYRYLLDIVENSDNPDQAIIDTLESIKDTIPVKVDNIGKLLRQWELDCEVIKSEEKRLAERRKTLENRREHLKEYVKIQLEAAGIPEVRTETLTVKIQNNPPAVEILQRELIPREYIKTEIVETVDKQAIKEALKNNEFVPGAVLVQGRSLRIK